MIIEIGDKTYNVKVAKTDEERAKGLSGITELPEDEGMLFYMDKPQKCSFWMKDTLIPLDIIFIDEDEEVISVHQGVPEDTTPITEDNVLYVLEVNANSGIEVGDQFDFDDKEDPNKYVMKVLAPDGTTQAELEGGERIFSRISTKQLIQWAKKAEANKDNEELFTKYCKRLGKRMFREIKAQNTRKPEYVEK